MMYKFYEEFYLFFDIHRISYNANRVLLKEHLDNYTQAKQYYKRILLSNDNLQQLNKKEKEIIIQKIKSFIYKK